MNKKSVDIDINSIKSPEFLKSLSYEDLDNLSESIRKEIITEVSKYGGHLSSNLGIVETTIALHRVFDFSKDKIIFDVGHQAYTHKILTGRHLDHIGEEGHVARFQKRCESPYDCFDAGHSSTSISAAEGFAIARDINKENYNVIAVIGDASIVNGLSLEAINDLSDKNHKIIIILNDNNMAISQPRGGLSNYFRKISSSAFYNKAKTKFLSKVRNNVGSNLYKISNSIKRFIRRILVHDDTLFEKMGLTYIGPVDGHNIKALEKALNRSKNTTKSTIIHVRTIKGKGYKYSENDSTGYWHGVGPFDIDTGKALNIKEGFVSWSSYFASLTKEMMDKHDNSYLIVPATLKGSALDDCFKDYPKRCIDVGIAEEHALTLAASLSVNNIHPIVSIYSTFLQRAYDEISHDCARSNANMTLLIDRSGLVGKDGETHQGIYDVAYLNSIPNVVVTMPTNKDEALALYKESFKNHGIFAIRFPRDSVLQDKIKEIDVPFGSFKFEKESTSKKLCVVAVGPYSNQILFDINKSKLDLTYANAIYLNKFNQETIDKLLTFDNLVIVDPYGTKEGFAQTLVTTLVEKAYKGNITCRCIPTDFVKQGNVSDQYIKFGVDSISITTLCSEILK